MTAEGIVGEGYGKVYLNYDTQCDKNQGDFSGGARTINNDVMVALCKAFGNATARRSPCTP